MHYLINTVSFWQLNTRETEMKRTKKQVKSYTFTFPNN